MICDDEIPPEQFLANFITNKKVELDMEDTEQEVRSLFVSIENLCSFNP